ncbi:MAG TPA: sulfurtransferase TusA [Gammaproteobacteria bacterium]|jgi:tRNA 2-thiouridine synthesizing protein A|nr:sulfurtransferase TusA [Gammaproteobacteria bacterium]HIF86956.1 sulfurtransferase TusA [Gammaproteobacteria bacterium]|tara:strand:- start:13709 stop:13984 length:276 start_codon:yes stop_codon:yes gene_type:complete
MPKERTDASQKGNSLIPKQELDARGLFCPEPVMLLHNKIREIEVGELLRLTASDPSTCRDVPKFCLYLGHELLEATQTDEEYIYLIRKSGS